jgi:hypothetical protein
MGSRMRRPGITLKNLWIESSKRLDSLRELMNRTGHTVLAETPGMTYKISKIIWTKMTSMVEDKVDMEDMEDKGDMEGKTMKVIMMRRRRTKATTGTTINVTISPGGCQCQCESKNFRLQSPKV